MPLRLVLKTDLENEAKNAEAEKDAKIDGVDNTKEPGQLSPDQEDDVTFADTKTEKKAETKSDPPKSSQRENGKAKRQASPRDDRPKKRVPRPKKRTPPREQSNPDSVDFENVYSPHYKRVSRSGRVRSRSPRRSRSRSPPRRNRKPPQKSDPRSRRSPLLRRNVPGRRSIGNWICGGCRFRNSKDRMECLSCLKKRDIPRGTGRNTHKLTAPPRSVRQFNVTKGRKGKRSPIKRNSPNDFRNSYRRAVNADKGPPQEQWQVPPANQMQFPMPTITPPIPMPGMVVPMQLQMPVAPMVPQPVVSVAPPPDPFAHWRVKNRFLPEMIPGQAQFTPQGTLIVPY